MRNIYTHRCTFLPFILLGFMMSPIHAQSDFIQQKYSLTFHHEPLDSVINKLQQLVDIGFSYNPAIVLMTPPITKSFNNESLKIILDSICLPNQLTYQIIGQNI